MYFLFIMAYTTSMKPKGFYWMTIIIFLASKQWISYWQSEWAPGQRDLIESLNRINLIELLLRALSSVFKPSVD